MISLSNGPFCPFPFEMDSELGKPKMMINPAYQARTPTTRPTSENHTPLPSSAGASTRMSLRSTSAKHVTYAPGSDVQKRGKIYDMELIDASSNDNVSTEDATKGKGKGKGKSINQVKETIVSTEDSTKGKGKGKGKSINQVKETIVSTEDATKGKGKGKSNDLAKDTSLSTGKRKYQKRGKNTEVVAVQTAIDDNMLDSTQSEVDSTQSEVILSIERDGTSVTVGSRIGDKVLLTPENRSSPASSESSPGDNNRNEKHKDKGKVYDKENRRQNEEQKRKLKVDDAVSSKRQKISSESSPEIPKAKKRSSSRKRSSRSSSRKGEVRDKEDLRRNEKHKRKKTRSRKNHTRYDTPDTTSSESTSSSTSNSYRRKNKRSRKNHTRYDTPDTTSSESTSGNLDSRVGVKIFAMGREFGKLKADNASLKEAAESKIYDEGIHALTSFGVNNKRKRHRSRRGY